MSREERPGRDPRAAPANVAAIHRRTSSPRGRRGRGEASVAELMPRVLGAGPSEATLFRLMAAWERALPHRLVQNARPVQLRRDVLVVAAATSAWAQEVTLRATSVLAALSRAVPEVKLAGMRVRTGRLPDRIVPAPAPVQRVEPLVRLPDALEATLLAVSDEALRGAIERAARASLGEVKRARRGGR